MPTVITEGRFRLVIHTRENEFEPPHVHVWINHVDVCRINLFNRSFMENPPRGESRNIRQIYRKHEQALWQAWETHHGR